MSSMKRVRLAVLFLIAAALLACTPALAAGQSITTNLTCVADPMDPDYGASGQATLSSVEEDYGPRPGGWYVVFRGRLSVSCANLTPKAMYEVRTNAADPHGSWAWWDFQASPRGVGAAGGRVVWSNSDDPRVEVFRVDETAEGTVETLVLTGIPSF